MCRLPSFPGGNACTQYSSPPARNIVPRLWGTQECGPDGHYAIHTRSSTPSTIVDHVPAATRHVITARFCSLWLSSAVVAL